MIAIGTILLILSIAIAGAALARARRHGIAENHARNKREG